MKSGQSYLTIPLQLIQWRCMKRRTLVVYIYLLKSEVSGLVKYSLVLINISRSLCMSWSISIP